MVLAFSIFSPVELSVIAITVAAVLVGFFLKPSRHTKAWSYIYPLEIEPGDDREGDGTTLEIEAVDDGSLLLRRRGVHLPTGATGHVTVDIVGDKVKVVEKYSKLSAQLPGAPQQVTVRLRCLKPRRYHLRYEATSSGLWGLATVVNGERFTATAQLRY